MCAMLFSCFLLKPPCLFFFFELGVQFQSSWTGSRSLPLPHSSSAAARYCVVCVRFLGRTRSFVYARLFSCDYTRPFRGYGNSVPPFSAARRRANPQKKKKGGGLGAPVLYRNKVRSRASSRGCPPSRAALWVSLRRPALSFAPLACASGNRDCRGPQNMGFLHAAFLESSRARSPRVQRVTSSGPGNAFFRKCSFFSCSCSRSERWWRS